MAVKSIFRIKAASKGRVPWLGQIWRRDTDGTWEFVGNGLVVADQTVLTCFHVVAEANDVDDPQDLDVRLNGRSIGVAAIRAGSIADLALLFLKAPAQVD